MEIKGTPELVQPVASSEAPAPAEPKKRSRRTMTKEEKQAAAQKRAEEKAKADSMKPVVYVQYQDSEADVEALVEAAKAEFHKDKKRTRITGLKLYIKPEERTAYYVINETFDGKVTY